MGKIRCVGVLTSGGDAPGMNAAIRSVTRSAICNGFKIKGIYRGYGGLINDDVKTFTTEDVSNIIQTGGTILRTARCKEFETPEGRHKAYETLQKEGIDALIVIGGNGSLTGAMKLAEEYDFPASVCREPLTTTSTAQTALSATTLPSTPSPNVWTRYATQLLHTNASFSSK